MSGKLLTFKSTGSVDTRPATRPYECLGERRAIGSVIDSKATFRVLDLLYETLDDPAKWGQWLDETCDVLKVDGGNLVYVSTKSPETSIIHVNHISDQQHQVYVEEYLEKDWQLQLIQDLPVGAAGAMSQFPKSVLSAYQDSEFFQEFARDTCMWMSMGGWFQRDDDWVGSTGFHRASLEHPYSPDEIQFLEYLHPHIARILQQSEYMALLEDALSITGHSGDGIFLIDCDARVQYANETACAIVRRGGMNVRDQRLFADDQADTARLETAISAILATEGVTYSAGADLFVARAQDPVPLIVSITPNYRKRPFYQSGTRPVRVVVTVKDPNHQPELKKRILRNLYGFTPRELEIGALLVEGLGLRPIAEELGMSYETARTHTKTMIQKAGIRGQSQLMAFLSAFRA